MKITNIEIKGKLREIEIMSDYYAKVKALCEFSGLVAFYANTKDNSFKSLQKTHKMAIDTYEPLIKKYNL